MFFEKFLISNSSFICVWLLIRLSLNQTSGMTKILRGILGEGNSGWGGIMAAGSDSDLIESYVFILI